MLTYNLIRTFANISKKNSFIKVYNPFNGEIYTEVPLEESEGVMKMIKRSIKVQKQWKQVPLIARQELCNTILKTLPTVATELGTDISCMMGKPLKQSINEIKGVQERGFTMINLSKKILKDEILPSKDGFVRKIIREPVGIVLTIVPWNYPLLCSINSIICAILSGNSIILKYSSQTPLIGNWWEKIFSLSGAPRYLCQALNADHSIINKIIQYPSIGHVNFTGSVHNGHMIYNNVAKRFISCTLELGGKDPAYISSDCDLDQTVNTVVDGSFYNAGQSCCAIERVYVHKNVFDSFIEKTINLIRSKYILGNPLDKKTSMGPMAQKKGLDTCLQHVNDAKLKGARVILGDKTGLIHKSRFMSPTLLINCNHDMKIMKEETFGPVLPIQVVKNDQEAISMCNDSNFGLTASVFTVDHDRFLHFSSKIQTGTVFQNCCDYLDPLLPWTGIKNTGIGISLSRHGFNAVTRLKSLNAKF